MQTRIKFCGMTRLQDVQAAIDLGVDALGFVFVKKSPRCLDISKAQQLFEVIPPNSFLFLPLLFWPLNSLLPV